MLDEIGTGSSSNRILREPLQGDARSDEAHPGSSGVHPEGTGRNGLCQPPTCSAHMSRFDWSTDSKLVLLDNGKLSVKIYFPESEEQFTKN